MVDKELSGIDLNKYLEKLRSLGLFIHDVENRKAYPNSFWNSLGYTAEDMTELGFFDYVHPDDLSMVEEAYGKVAIDIHESYRLKFRIKDREGKWHWVLSSSLGLEKSENGETLKYIGFDHDITKEEEARMRAEKSLKEAESLIRATEIISSSLDLKSTVDAILEQAGNVLPFTSASVQLLEGDALRVIGDIGLKEKETSDDVVFNPISNTPNYHVIKNRKPYIVNSGLKEEYPDFLDNSVKGIRSWLGVPLICKGRLIGVFVFDHAEEHWFNEDYIRLAQAFAGHVAVALENSRLFEEVKKLAVKDELTGCFSRRHFFESLERESTQAVRYETPLSVLMFDVDDFKSINDNFGHIVGDRVLKLIAHEASGCLRAADIFCRYGGEEFIVLMPSTGLDEAFIVAERVRLAIEELIPDENAGIPVTVSVGCTVFCESDYENPDNMIIRVDRAMYDSKACGKNRTTLITPPEL